MRVFKWILLVAILGLWGVETVWAEQEKEEAAEEEAADKEKDEDEEDEEEDKGPKFAKVIKDFDKIEGLFELYRDPEENKVFLAIRPDQFDQIYLCSITRTQGDGYFFDSASLVSIGRGSGTFPFVFQRVGKKVFFAHKNVYYRAEPDAAIRRAVDRGLSDSILGVGSIEGQPHPETGAVLVDPSDFFIQDIASVSSRLGRYLKEGSYRFDNDNSYFGTLKNFPHNTEIDVVLHFANDAPKMDIPTLADTRSFQHIYHYSLSNLPESDFRPRLADDRVGHFTTLYQDYTSVLKDDPYVRYVERWHLEKAEPKFKRSPPKKPIVFWLENTIPPEYRDAVREGILVWNKAFEPLGFEGAIVVKQQPDDAEWDAADVRYSVVRWMVQPGQGYAVGPSRTNPFTGEIFDADIRISADFVRYAHLEFTELVDPVGRGPSVAAPMEHSRGFCNMADGLRQEAAFGWHLLEARAAAGGDEVDEKEFIRQLLVELIAHEVGHTLGLRHNFKGSTIHALDELHDRRVTDKEGISSSVMDYNPVNIAPEGHEQGEYYQTTLGLYDYWAIEYAYRPVEADSPESERGPTGQNRRPGRKKRSGLRHGRRRLVLDPGNRSNRGALGLARRSDCPLPRPDRPVKRTVGQSGGQIRAKGRALSNPAASVRLGLQALLFGSGQCQPLHRRHLSLPRPRGRWTAPATAGAAGPTAGGTRFSGGARVRAGRLSLVAGATQQAGTRALGRFHLVGVRRTADRLSHPR